MPLVSRYKIAAKIAVTATHIHTTAQRGSGGNRSRAALFTMLMPNYTRARRLPASGGTGYYLLAWEELRKVVRAPSFAKGQEGQEEQSSERNTAGLGCRVLGI